MVNRLLTAVLILFALSQFAVAQFDATDPSSRSSNARVDGMGRAFTAIADDTAAIYFNPAGLASTPTWQLTSMSGKLMDDYNYLGFSGYYPTNFGTVGIGFGGYNIGGALPTTIEAGSDQRDPIYVVDTNPNNPEMSNYNNVFTLTYATQMDRFLSRYLSFSDKIDAGVNLKLFSTGLSGDHITSGNASGQEMDAGIIWRAMPALKFGVTGQNVLPASLGGKLTYLSGHVETYPANLKLGVAAHLIGDENAFRTFPGQDVLLALDIEKRPTVTDDPMLYHLGVEWMPYPLVAIRAGLDQISADDGSGKFVAASNMTYGVGLYYQGFRFDYAYHQFAGLAIDNTFFSLSYSPVIKLPSKVKDKVTVSVPADKSITFDQMTRVRGQVNVPEIKSLEINDIAVKLSKSNSFDADAPLNVGKNKLSIQSYGDKGKIQKPVDSQNIRILRLAAFPDVPDGYWARQQVSLISMLNIVTGYPDGTFRPEGSITRAEMAALLMRGNASIARAGSTTKFSDVKANHWAAQFIADAATLGVVEGYPDKTFRPKGNITRAEGLAMIARFAKVSQEAYSFQYFPDVSSSYWASPIIAGSSRAGMLDFLKGRAFEPKRNMTRAEAVEILYRTQYTKKLLDRDLFNWESY